MLRYNPDLKQIARKLRAEMTDSEQRLWSRLRSKQLKGVQFYRQKPIGSYIVDFYAPKAKLVIEVDGSQNLDVNLAKQDEERDGYLAAIAPSGIEGRCKMPSTESVKLLARVTAIEILAQHLLFMIVSSQPDPLAELEGYRSRVLSEYNEATIKNVDAATSDAWAQELVDALDALLSPLISRVRENR